MSYGPKTITIATKHTLLPKQVYLQYNSIVVDMKRNQKYQRLNKYNISDLEAYYTTQKLWLVLKSQKSQLNYTSTHVCSKLSLTIYSSTSRQERTAEHNKCTYKR